MIQSNLCLDYWTTYSLESYIHVYNSHVRAMWPMVMIANTRVQNEKIRWCFLYCFHYRSCSWDSLQSPLALHLNIRIGNISQLAVGYKMEEFQFEFSLIFIINYCTNRTEEPSIEWSNTPLTLWLFPNGLQGKNYALLEVFLTVP